MMGSFLCFYVLGGEKMYLGVVKIYVPHVVKKYIPHQ